MNTPINDLQFWQVLFAIIIGGFFLNLGNCKCDCNCNAKEE